MTAWNPEKVRQDFVLLRNTDRVYFDNAATSQKPQCVLVQWRSSIRNTTPMYCVGCIR